MEIDEVKNGCNGIEGSKPLTLDWDNLLDSGDDDHRPEIIVTSIKKSVEEKNGCNGIKGSKPLTLDWDHLLDSGDDDRPSEIIVTSIEKSVDDSGGSTEADTLENQEPDIELMTKTDREINDFISRQKNLDKICDKLSDRGVKLKAILKRYKAEFERRNKAKLQKMGNEVDRSHDYRTETQNLVASNVEAPFAKRLSPRKTMKGPLQYAPWTNQKSTPCDPLTDEKMQRIVNELVRVGIPEFDVGKAAEVCYNDPVKVKVLFALPSHMRKSYVCGFLHPHS